MLANIIPAFSLDQGLFSQHLELAGLLGALAEQTENGNKNSICEMGLSGERSQGALEKAKEKTRVV